MICVSHSKMRSESAKSRLTFLQHNNQQRSMLTAADALIPPLIIRVDMVIMIVLLSSASNEVGNFSELSIIPEWSYISACVQTFEYCVQTVFFC